MILLVAALGIVEFLDGKIASKGYVDKVFSAAYSRDNYTIAASGDGSTASDTTVLTSLAAQDMLDSRFFGMVNNEDISITKFCYYNRTEGIFNRDKTCGFNISFRKQPSSGQLNIHGKFDSEDKYISGIADLYVNISIDNEGIKTSVVQYPDASSYGHFFVPHADAQFENGCLVVRLIHSQAARIVDDDNVDILLNTLKYGLDGYFKDGKYVLRDNVVMKNDLVDGDYALIYLDIEYINDVDSDVVHTIDQIPCYRIKNFEANYQYIHDLAFKYGVNFENAGDFNGHYRFGGMILMNDKYVFMIDKINKGSQLEKAVDRLLTLDSPAPKDQKLEDGYRMYIKVPYVHDGRKVPTLSYLSKYALKSDIPDDTNLDEYRLKSDYSMEVRRGDDNKLVETEIGAKYDIDEIWNWLEVNVI